MRDAPGGLAAAARHVAAPALPAGARLDEYRIDATLGGGRWGITYLATDVRLNARVVIREYLPREIAFRSGDGSIGPNASRHRMRYERGLAAFLRHARALAGVRHPGVVRVLRFFEAQRSAYLVLEHEKGQPLKTWWPARTAGGEAGLVALLRPLCDALAAVHAAGLQHGDLRPENILVRDDGQPVLVDFASAELALAVALDSAAAATPGFAAPELASGGPQGPWTELYALGATLYWCIAGRRPVDAAERQRDALLHMRAVEAGRGRFGEPFLQAIDRAMALDPSRRPHDILEFRLALFDEHPLPVRGDATLLSHDTVISGAEELSPAAPRLRRLPGASGGISTLALKAGLLGALAALLPALLVAAWLLQAADEAVRSAQQARLQAQAEGAAGRVAQWLAGQRLWMRQLATDPDLVLYLARPDDDARLVLQDRVARVLALRRDVAALAVLDLRGRLLLATEPAAAAAPLAARPEVQMALGGRAAGPGRPDQALALAEPVTGDDGRVLGALLARLDAAAPRALLGGAAAPLLREARDGRDTITGYAVTGGERLAWAPVAGHDWVVAVGEAADGPLQALRWPLGAALLAAALAAGGAGWWLGRKLVQPAADLTRAAGALAAGDFNNATVPVRRRDEMGELAKAFNVMVDVLRQRERERDRGG